MLKKNGKRRTGKTFVMVLLILLVGIAPNFFAAWAKENPIKIGILQPMTGPFVIYGHPGSATAQYMAEKINERGGVLGRPIEIIVKDDKNTPEIGLREAKSLILSEKCMFIGGCSSSAVASTVSDYVKTLNGRAFFLVHCASASSILEEHGHRYVGRVGVNTDAVPRAMMMEAGRLWPDTQRIFLLNPNYNYGHLIVKAFKALMPQKFPKAKIVGEAWPPLGTKDFTGYISAIMAAKPDLIQSTLWGTDAVSFLKQAEPYGLLSKCKIMCENMALQEVLGMFRKGDLGVPIGVLGANPYDYYNHESKEAVDQYTWVHKKTGYYPGAVMGQMAIQYIAAAMEKAGTTTDLEKIVDALAGLTIKDPVLGSVMMRGCDHQTIQGDGIGLIGWDKTGKFPFPIIPRDSIRYVPPDGLYKSCEEIMKLRETVAKRGGEKK